MLEFKTFDKHLENENSTSDFVLYLKYYLPAAVIIFLLDPILPSYPNNLYLKLLLIVIAIVGSNFLIANKSKKLARKLVNAQNQNGTLFFNEVGPVYTEYPPKDLRKNYSNWKIGINSFNGQKVEDSQRSIEKLGTDNTIEFSDGINQFKTYFTIESKEDYQKIFTILNTYHKTGIEISEYTNKLKSYGGKYLKYKEIQNLKNSNTTE